MRIGLRVVVSLSVVAVSLTRIFAYFEVRAEQGRIRQDLEKHAEILAESLAQTVEIPLARGSRTGLERTLERVGTKMVGLAVYDPAGETLAVTTSLTNRLTTRPAVVDIATGQDSGTGGYLQLGNQTLYIYALPIHSEKSL